MWIPLCSFVDAESLEDTRNTNDYTTTPAVSSAPLYENIQMQSHPLGNSVPTYADDANPYQQLSHVNRPQSIYEALFKQTVASEYCV